MKLILSERSIRCKADRYTDMKFRTTMCVLLGLLTMTAAGCSQPAGDDTNKNNSASGQTMPATQETYEEVKTFMGESATYGDMTVTVSKVEDPEIIMENSGKMAIFFDVTIENGTEETVVTNYLNNFAVTVDGTYYDSSDCFTIPVMKKLYDTTGEEAFQTEIAAGATISGSLAAEVPKDFKELHLHYIPKTTDRGSRVTVELSAEDVTKAE